MGLVTTTFRSNPQVPRPSLGGPDPPLLYGPHCLESEAALVLWQKSDLMLLEGGRSQEEKPCLLSTLASSLRKPFYPSPKAETSRQMWDLSNRTDTPELRDCGNNKALCAWSHLQGGGVEIYVFTVACSFYSFCL